MESPIAAAAASFIVTMFAVLYGTPEVIEMLETAFASGVFYYSMHDTSKPDIDDVQTALNKAYTDPYDGNNSLYDMLEANIDNVDLPDICKALQSYLTCEITREVLIGKIISSTTLDEFAMRLLYWDRDLDLRYNIFGDETAHRKSYAEESDRIQFDACEEMFCTNFKTYLEQALRDGVVQIEGQLMPSTWEFPDPASATQMIKKIDSTRYVTDHEIRQFAAMSACTAGYIITFVFAIDKYHFTRLSSK
jgi:hypothetical protein